MNPEREFRFANRVAGKIISIQLFIEDKFLRPPKAIILSLDKLDDIGKEEWMAEFRRIINE